MKEFFRMVNRMTAKQIYVPKILRKYVPTVETKAGTRLKSSINYTPCCTSEAEQLVCDHPKRQRDYYSVETFKCWKCKKIVVAN